MLGADRGALFERQRKKEVVLVNRWRKFVWKNMVDEVLGAKLKLPPHVVAEDVEIGGQSTPPQQTQFFSTGTAIFLSNSCSEISSSQILEESCISEVILLLIFTHAEASVWSHKAVFSSIYAAIYISDWADIATQSI